MNRVELEGVLAHELSHVKNYDILVSTLAVTMVGLVAMPPTWHPADVVGRWAGTAPRRRPERRQRPPYLADLRLRPADPRPARRPADAPRGQPPAESLADVSAVEMTRYPPGLISALEKLRDDTTVVHATPRHGPPVDRGARRQERGRGPDVEPQPLFDTHPPIEERIASAAR